MTAPTARASTRSTPMLFSRQRQLLQLLDALGGSSHMVDFQKLLFLYCQDSPEGQAPYDFVPYKYGAFSFTSYADRRKLIDRGLLEDNDAWQITAEARKLIGRASSTRLAAFAKRYRGQKGDALVADTYRRFPFFATRSGCSEFHAGNVGKFESRPTKTDETGLIASVRSEGPRHWRDSALVESESVGYGLTMGARRRVDRIRQFLEKRGGRVRMREIHAHLRQEEADEDLSAAAIYAAIRNENDRETGLGQAPPFQTKREGEAHGWVSLSKSATSGAALGEIEKKVHEANAAIDGEIRAKLQKMDWRTFESEFLTILLEKLGFQDVEVTQATKDGGVDARVAYRRGIVSAKALVSAKHWGSANVAVSEVRNVRGIKGDEDTAIIVTSGAFTRGATEEASPSAGQRLVYLIDGNEIVNACKQYGIGVRRKVLPELLEIDEQFFQGSPDDEADEPDDPDPERGGEKNSTRRLREEMLGDTERGLSVGEIAALTGLSESTVTQYLYVPERRRSLFEKIRGDASKRQNALQIVGRKRRC